LKLPAVTKDGAGRYVPLELATTFSNILAVRAAAIEAAALAYVPHLILVDHAPLGMAGELITALHRARAERPSTRIVLGLRDIYDEGSLVRESWSREGIPAMLERMYDRILVYGQRRVFDVASEYSLDAAVGRKITYTGYIYRPEPAGEPAESLRSRLAAGTEAGPLVLVTVGGGGDGHSIIQNYLQGLAAMGSTCPWRSLVVTGPLMSSWWKKLAKEAAQSLPSVTLLDFTPNLRDYIAAADVVLTMGGYNTLVEALALGKRAVVVPRATPRKEQLVRAERFGRLGLIRWLDPRHASPQNLVGSVKEALSAPPPDLGDLDFGGIDRTVQEIGDLLGETVAPVAVREPSSREMTASSSPRTSSAT
jgi:predicted glycosyltransferase